MKENFKRMIEVNKPMTHVQGFMQPMKGVQTFIKTFYTSKHGIVVIQVDGNYTGRATITYQDGKTTIVPNVSTDNLKDLLKYV